MEINYVHFFGVSPKAVFGVNLLGERGSFEGGGGCVLQ